MYARILRMPKGLKFTQKSVLKSYIIVEFTNNIQGNSVTFSDELALQELMNVMNSSSYQHTVALGDKDKKSHPVHNIFHTLYLVSFGSINNSHSCRSLDYCKQAGLCTVGNLQ